MKWLIFAILLLTHIIGLLVFLKGFFPSKVVLSGFSEFSHGSVSPFKAPKRPQQFDKFVVMVVDAMRADFMYSESNSHMSFVHELISSGSAIPYTSFSNPPTVTLPRLKGITTGGTPSFIDAILNVADDKDDSQGLSAQDSWIRQFRFKEKGKVINFYGDDTWLKLFPKEEFFGETDGTNSFFVSDFTEVDNNVTRHLDSQLSSTPSKWDGLILHYLGLDHIGHKGGPNSVYMKDKQEEMDAIIKRIYTYITSDKKQAEDTLFIILGDHGMNEVGNHGGSSDGETSPGLLFVSPKFQKTKLGISAPVQNTENYSYYNRVNQIDLVPTLSVLLNFPIPKNNLGVIIKEHLLLWDKLADRQRILLENCYQFKTLVDAKYGIDLDSQEIDDTDDELKRIKLKWDSLNDSNNAKDETLSKYFDFLYETQQVLASSATNYNYEDIKIGFTLLAISALVVTTVFFWHYSTFAKNVSILFPAGFLIFTLAYSTNFLASSFIEEEHQIWWFFTIISLISVFVYTRFSRVYMFIIVLACIRAIRAFSNTGQKFKTPYTFAAYLLNNSDVLWALNILTFMVISISIYGQGYFINCFAYPNYTTYRDRHANDFGPLFTFIGVFVTISLSFSFKLIQYYNDGNAIPVWLEWLLVWNCEAMGVSNLESADKKLLQSVLIQLSRFFVYALSSIFAFRLILGKLRGINRGMFTDLGNMIIAFLIHQTRPELIPIFLFFFIIRFAIAKTIYDLKDVNLYSLITLVAVFTLCLQNVSFFSMGNTNSLATVDLSNAYNGIESFDVFLVGVLTFVSSYVGPIFWSITSIGWLLEANILSLASDSKFMDIISIKKLKYQIFQIKSLISLTFYSICAVVLVGSCINLRFHLFIWTVFSPKLLFFASWTLLVNFLVELVTLGLLLSVC